MTRLLTVLAVMIALTFGARIAPASAMMCYSFFNAQAWYDDGTPDGYYVGFFDVQCFDDGSDLADPGPVWV